MAHRSRITRNQQKVLEMDWETIEDRLQPGTRAQARAASDVAALREYFGEQEFAELQELAEYARLRRSRGIAGNVVFLPGIMGSNLTVSQGGGADLVWMNLFRLVAGDFAQLQLSDDGLREAHTGLQIRPTALDKRTYARAILWLRSRWNVAPFPYDWRKDIDAASDALAEFIRNQFNGQPVHLVAHSMGGLVSRNFIRLHKALWDQMRDTAGVRGGRLIMLGTPNYGSFAIPQALTGVEKMVRWLVLADLNHDLPDVLDILKTFVGSYQMLPAPSKVPAAIQDLYRPESWAPRHVLPAHLKRAFQFHADLERGGTIDPTRMIYIAGCNQETVHKLRLVARSEFEYTTTLDGDGRVPHALGLLKDVPTYYVEEVHGDLPRHKQVLAALDELLETGTTSVLPTRPLAARASTLEGARWHRSLGERAIGAQLQQIANRAKRDEASPEEVRRAEEALLDAALGRHQENARLIDAEVASPAEGAQEGDLLSLHVEVVCGDITKVASPVLVVGQYKGVPPAHAVGALDKMMAGWIGKGLERGMVGAELGATSFIPISTKNIRAKAILLAGMGEPGKFTRDDLHFLMSNVGYAVSALGLSQLATVLVGSGAGGIPLDSAVRALLNGMCEALQRLQQESPTTSPVRRVMLVEFDKARYERVVQIVTDMAENHRLPGIKLRVTSRLMPGRRGATRQRPEENVELKQTRITIERHGDTFRFAGLAETAVVPVREVQIQAFFAEEAANRLKLAQDSEEQQKYGKLLNTYLIPEAFHAVISSHDILTLILDRSTAAFPWEMACFKGAAGPVFFGPDLKLTRQFRTMLSAPPGLAPVLNKRLKVLVVADPAPEPELQLPGARREGREVTTRLQRLKRDTGLEIEVVDYIGAAECDPVDILAQILTDNFDVIHFAGHGTFDEQNPVRSGWVFGKDRVLSAREIFTARQVPRLVFANACFSAVMKEGAPLSAADTARKLASLAEAFFERGVQNYIGTGWPVADGPAVALACTFYERALRGEYLAEALAAGRKAILAQGPTWGAYHHYGDPNAKLVP